MKSSGRLLHRHQGVQRTERDLLSLLIAEGRLSSDWLVKCGDNRLVSDLSHASKQPLNQASRLAYSDGDGGRLRDPVYRGDTILPADAPSGLAPKYSYARRNSRLSSASTWTRS